MNFCNNCGNEFSLEGKEERCPLCDSSDIELALNTRLINDIFDMTGDDDFLDE